VQGPERAAAGGGGEKGSLCELPTRAWRCAAVLLVVGVQDKRMSERADHRIARYFARHLPQHIHEIFG